MARDGFFTGLDIGTSSIKVLVAEHVNNELNVIGVSNAKSAGVKDGIIVDIEAAASAIKSAISQAEEKAGISIHINDSASQDSHTDVTGSYVLLYRAVYNLVENAI